MTNKVAFMNENDNDSHLDLQVEIQKNIYFFYLINNCLEKNFRKWLFIASYGEIGSKKK